MQDILSFTSSKQLLVSVTVRLQVRVVIMTELSEQAEMVRLVYVHLAGLGNFSFGQYLS